LLQGKEVLYAIYAKLELTTVQFLGQQLSILVIHVALEVLIPKLEAHFVNFAILDRIPAIYRQLCAVYAK